MKTIALILAAGKGLRFGDRIPKQFRVVHNRPLLAWTIRQFEKAAMVDEIVIIVAEDYLIYTNEKIVNRFEFGKVAKIVPGGETRRESVLRGLKSLPISTGFVAIHDGARPLTFAEDIDRVIAAAHKERAAILARPIMDTVKRVEQDFILATLDRERLYLAETPQVFQYDLILSAHEGCGDSEIVTDDSVLVERLGFKVKMVKSAKYNIKITTEEDLSLVRMLLEAGDEA